MMYQKGQGVQEVKALYEGSAAAMKSSRWVVEHFSMYPGHVSYQDAANASYVHK